MKTHGNFSQAIRSAAVKLFISCLTISHFQPSFGQISSTREAQLIRAFLSKIEPCMVYEFSRYGYALASDRPQIRSENSPLGSVSRENISELAQAWSHIRYFKHPGGSSDPYGTKNRMSPFFPFHSEIEAAFQKLEAYMRFSRFDSISTSTLINMATEEFDRLVRDEKVGECYRVHSFHYGIKAKTVNIMPEMQKKFSDIFKRAATAHNNQHFTPDTLLSKNEYYLLTMGSLNPDELMELRALRRATAEFGLMTPLRDNIGGWMGNMTVEMFPMKSDQANCIGNALTFSEFILKMIDRGFVQYFALEDGYSFRKSSSSWHAAIVIRNLRTNERLVLDAWLDGANEPARILRFADWIEHEDSKELVNTLQAN